MAEVRNNWEGQVVNGIFPLRRFLSSSDHSSVFLTESTTEGFLNAAIKIVPADPSSNEVQLWHWRTAATFSHPNLIRLLDCGQCEIDGRQLLFVVMEYAEESLSQILPYRALGPDEVRELLVPTLDALAFLHRENWVQGQLKPSNFLVVDDQLKLATDTIRPIAVSRANFARPTLYDPPESANGEVLAAGDIWALGVTLVEALTQYPPTWLNGRTEPPSLPTNLPPTFEDTVQRCLSLSPADRPTISDLQAQTKPAPNPPPGTSRPSVRPEPSRVASEPEPVIRADSRPFAQLAHESKRGWLAPALVALAVVAVAVWGGLQLLRGHGTSDQSAGDVALPASVSAQDATPVQPNLTSEAPPPASTRANVPPSPRTHTDADLPSSLRKHLDADVPQARGTSTNAGRPMSTAVLPPPPKAPLPAGEHSSTDAASSAVHEEIPNVPASARGTIHGRIKVGIRVTVDKSGRVVHDSLDNPGPSNYFNRLASAAARKWKFAAADDRGSQEWLLWFEFGRDGTTVRAVRPKS